MAIKYQYGITKLFANFSAPKCIDVQSVACINCPPFGSLASGTNHLFTNHAKSSIVIAVIRLAQPRKNAFLRFLFPNNLKVISSNKAAKLMRKDWKQMVLIHIANYRLCLSTTVKLKMICQYFIAI